MPELTEKEKTILDVMDQIINSAQVKRITLLAAHKDIVRGIVKKTEAGPVLHNGKALQVSIDKYRGVNLQWQEPPAPRYNRKSTRDWVRE